MWDTKEENDCIISAILLREENDCIISATLLRHSLALTCPRYQRGIDRMNQRSRALKAHNPPALSIRTSCHALCCEDSGYDCRGAVTSNCNAVRIRNGAPGLVAAAGVGKRRGVRVAEVLSRVARDRNLSAKVSLRQVCGCSGEGPCAAVGDPASLEVRVGAPCAVASIQTGVHALRCKGR